MSYAIFDDKYMSYNILLQNHYNLSISFVAILLSYFDVTYHCMLRAVSSLFLNVDIKAVTIDLWLREVRRYHIQ